MALISEIKAGEIWYVGDTPVVIEKVCKAKVRVHSNYNPKLNHKLLKPHWITLDGSISAYINRYSCMLPDYVSGDDLTVWNWINQWRRDYRRRRDNPCTNMFA